MSQQGTRQIKVCPEVVRLPYGGVRLALNILRWCTAASVGCLIQTSFAADAISPIDFTRRNEPFAVQPSVSAGKETPATNRTVQDARVPTEVRSKTTSPVGMNRSGIPVAEAQPKRILEQKQQQPQKTEQPKNDWNRRPAAITTNDQTAKPPLVAKYQESLVAASAANMSRFPALDGGTKATVNRFVFRKNGPDAESAAVPVGATPAAGGSPVRK